MSGWFNWQWKADDSAPASPQSPSQSNTPAAAAPAQGGGIFAGVSSFMKDLLGVEQLKVEEINEGEKKNDLDQEKRKGLFKQLSSLVGKDITSMISLPVWVFEPVSFLQVMAEPLAYSELLRQAARSENSLERLAYIAAFNLALHSLAIRAKKPFNPFLGETFELMARDGSFRFLAEQVSHHPPIGVSETQSEDFILQLETHLKSQFYGNSTEIGIQGTNHLVLPRTGDHFTWGHLTTACHNIIVGTLWIDHYGELLIENHTTGEKCILKVNKAGWLGVGRYVSTGEIFDKEGNLRMRVRGKWNESLTLINVEGDQETDSKLIWQAINEPYNNKWNVPRFTAEEILNVDPDLEAILPQSDSRLRPDRRALEAGDIDLAGKKKHELEEIQRSLRREREANQEHWATRWFRKVDDPKFGYLWRFNDQYWQERQARVAQLEAARAASPAPASPSAAAPVSPST